MTDSRPLRLLIALGCGTPVILFLCLWVGSTPIPVDALFTYFFSAVPTDATPIIELRMPRVLGAFAVGGCLALAGALMQVLVRNPLADPYILGISGGAALGALTALWIGIGMFWVRTAALAGALIATLLVFVAARGRGPWSPLRLLLSGVVLASAWGALISVILAVAPEANLRGMLFWLMGDFSFMDTSRVEWLVLGLCTMFAYAHARDLNVLAQGDDQATLLGVNTTRLRWILFTLSALLAAVAVSAVGSIGFVGLVAPHIARLWVGSDHRYALGAAILVGGNGLALADTIARTATAPLQLPVGAITALIGIPLFLYLLQPPRTRSP